MQSAIFNTPVLKLARLKTKFDTSIVSNSFVALIGDYLEARIVQQLHYWCYSEYGVIINNIRWIYKPIREWLTEAFVGFTSWQLRKAIASLLQKGLIEREKLFVEHHQQEHNCPWWNPKNQTYYYSLNYDKLQELFEQVENPETIENVSIVSDTKLSVAETQNTKFCECPQNKTKNTSIENNSIDESHPALPCVSQNPERSNQEKQYSSNPELLESNFTNLVNPKVVEKEIKAPQLEQNINQTICTNKVVVRESVQIRANEVDEVAVNKPVAKPKIKTPKGTKSVSKRMKSAPWKDEGQFKRFYRALIQALPIVANARSPQGLAQVIIRQLRSGIPHSYWDDFVAGLPIGASTKPEWEVEPGVPYPMFIEYLTEKLIKGNNTQTSEQARNEVFRILSQPRQASAFWGQFKRSVVNVSEQVERDRDLGVSNPNTPVWTRERIEPSIKEAISAGKKIMAVNGATFAAIDGSKTNHHLEAESQSNPSPRSPAPDPWSDDEAQPTLRETAALRKIKGFVKAMPKVSQSEAQAEARREIKPKTNISQMSVAEINDYLTDPILRAQLTSQLMRSDYELITDEIGQIIGVKAPPPTEE